MGDKLKGKKTTGDLLIEFWVYKNPHRSCFVKSVKAIVHDLHHSHTHQSIQ